MVYTYRKNIISVCESLLASKSKADYIKKIRSVILIFILFVSVFSFNILTITVEAIGNPPFISNPSPNNGSTNQSLNPTLSITVNDPEGNNMNITWYSNSSGLWVAFGTNTSCSNGTYYQINSNFSIYDTTYWWNVTVNDGTDENTSSTYYFTTIGMPNVTYVDDDFNESTPGWNATNFNSITPAIEKVSEGGTVYVYNGTYNETDMSIRKPLHLEGEDWRSVIVNGTGGENGSVFWLQVNDTTISNFTLTGIEYGVDFQQEFSFYPTNNTVRDCKLENCGFYMGETGENNSIINCWIDGFGGEGLEMDQTDRCIIKYNNFTNLGGSGIQLIESCNYNEIDNNTFINCSSDGIALLQDSSNNTISNNSIINCTIGVRIDYHVTGASNNIIRENNFSGNSQYAVYVDGGGTPHNNSFYMNTFGDDCEDSGAGEFWDNGVYGNYYYNYDELGERAWDNNSDGIVDDPYTVPGTLFIDNYPLMNPWDGPPPPPPTENVTYVDDDFNESTPGWCETSFNDIQNALDLTEVNGTIYVYSGNYTNTPYIVSQPVSIIGTSPSGIDSGAIIDGGNTGMHILNTRDVFVTNMTFRNIAEEDVGPITPGDPEGIKVTNSSFEFVGNTFQDNMEGIYLENTTNWSINNNYFRGNEWCDIILDNTSFGNIENCIFLQSQSYGIYAGWEYDDNDNLVVANNSFNIIDGYAIEIDGTFGVCHNISVINNTISNITGGGIQMNGVHADSWILENRIFNTTNRAIEVFSSQNITVSENSILNCSSGLIVLGVDTIDVFLYYNNIYNCSDETARDSTGSVIWDDGVSIGNWWEEYDESNEGAWDNNTDGIVDDPYNISGSAGAQDRYPLVNPWPPKQAPTVITNDSAGVRETNTTLWGYLSDNGNATTTCGFWYDTTSGGTTNNQSVGIVSEGNTFSYNASSLTAGQLYYFKAWANNSEGWDTAANEKTFLTKPNVTTGLTAQANGSTMIYLTWTAGDGANNTYIERNVSDVTVWVRDAGTVIYNGSNSSYEDTDLAVNTRYYYQAWSYTNWTYNPTLQQWSDNNDSANDSTLTVPIVTTNASTGVEETNATLWGYLQNDGGENSIVRFEYGITTDYGTNTSNQTKSTGQTFTVNLSSLTRGQIYHFRAYANNTIGNSTGSNKTFLTKPDSPSGLVATASSSSQIDITWTKGNGTNNTYIVRKTGSYPSSRTDGTSVYNGTGTNFSNTGLSASTKYYYSAWSCASEGSLLQWSDSYVNASATTKAGGGGGGSPPPTPPGQDDEEDPLTTKELIEELFNITLLLNFSANDTDEDGIVDTFLDPNDVLESERYIILNDNASFLISVYNDLDKLFIWDTKADTITLVTHTSGVITADVKDNKNKTRVVSATIEKTDWVYIEVSDQYPSYPLLNVQTSDGRNISIDMIWREEDKIFVLDDPEIEYQFIYSSKKKVFLFDVLLDLAPASVNVGENINALITLINVGEPGLVNATVVYTLYKGTEIIWTEEENLSVLGQIAFNKTLSTGELSEGEYTYEVVHYYGDNQTASAQSLFTLKTSSILVESPFWTLPTVAILLLTIFVLVALILFWFFKIRRKR